MITIRMQRRSPVSHLLSQILLRKTTTLVWRGPWLVVFWVVLWVALSLKKTIGYGRFLLALSVAPLLVVRLMEADPRFWSQLGAL